jgi:superfamily I DNA and/or RNA helicase
MYAPYLLPKFEPRKEPLLTPLAPKPDPSQKEAILQSLTHTINGIQGPPGTGKSQTIAALIDEYILRNKNQKPLKILVTSFSYAALRVVFNNIIKSKNHDGTPTKAAHSTCAFMRSQDRKKVAVNEPYWDLTFRDKQETLVLERISESAEGKISSQTEIVTKDTTEKLEDILSKDESHLILFGNAHQLFHLNSTYSYRRDLRFIHRDFQFDLIVIDEASQLPVNYFLSALQFIKKYRFYVCSDHFNAKTGNVISSPKELEALYLCKNLHKKANKNEFQSNELTKVVIVGDQNQLPPVHPVKPPKKLEPILDNLFGYYCDHHSVPNKQLEFNYRSNQKIVDFTNFLDIYTNKISAKTNKNAKINHSIKKIQDWNVSHPFKLEKWIQEGLDPSKIMGTFIHNRKYETAVSEVEANIVSKLIMGYYIMSMPNPKRTKSSELENAELTFWREKLGVVAPHNAQGRLIIKKIYELFTKCDLNFLMDQKLMNLLKTTVVSVEKFQGSARDVIIASIGISARDQLMAETEFIYDLNRFNVLTSRARKKFLLICSENFLKFIPEDRTLMENAAKIRRFAYEFCNESRIISASEEINDTKLQFRYLK